MSGYIKLYRGLTDNPLWTSEPFTAGQAWIDLLLAANFKATTIYVRKVKFRLDRGQLAWSQVTMAKRWQWSRNKVARFIKDLEEEGMIEHQGGHLTTVTTICNYSKYQASEAAGGAADEASDEAAGGAQYKKVNKGKKGKNNYTDDFETAWAEYPKREGNNPKGSAFKAWNGRLSEGHTPEEMIEGVKRYARFCRAKGQVGGQYVKQASTFFGPDEHFLAEWQVAKPSVIQDPLNAPAYSQDQWDELDKIMKECV